MCWHHYELQRDIRTYDMVKYIGGVLGYDLVDLLDLMTYNPNTQTEDDVNSFFFEPEFESVDDTVTVEYDLEVDNDELESLIDEMDDTDDDDESTIDLTIDH